MSRKKNFKKVLALILISIMTLTFLPGISAKAEATGAPGKAVCQHNQYGEDVDGNYDILVNMWYGNNGISYKLYERLGIKGEFKVVDEGALKDNTPSAQTFTIQVRGRTVPGTYYYYVELTNAYGSSSGDLIKVKVGAGETSNILIENVDDNKIEVQFTVDQGVTNFNLSNSESKYSTFKVLSSNTSTVEASIVNSTLKINALTSGRSGLKIIDETTGEVRYIGVRVRNKDGSLPRLPDYVSIGQVSEDTKNDLDFWKDIDTDDTNKRCDIRYIYVNGGPLNGWRSWTTQDGGRVITYIKESLKLGMVPYFVFYNIPDSSEDFNTDLRHVNDKSYMEAYYKDLKFFLDLINQYAEDERVGIILEPDFIGYMMQNTELLPSEIVASGVEGVYSSGILEKGKDPDFTNTITGICKSINYIIDKYSNNVTFGWQFNTWGYHKTGTPGNGLMHATETMGWSKGREFIKNAAKSTAEYYMDAGILSYGADFISIDKYGLDGAYAGQANNPQDSNWFWNADLWNNYLYYTKTLHETTKKPVTLWQLPVGHINTSQEANPYEGGLFKNLTNSEGSYEDSAPTFFFGDTFKAGGGDRLKYFSKNEANDSKISVNGDTITYGSHIEEARDAGITMILFGAGVGASTDAVGSPPADNYWWITKAQRYYKNPVKLKADIVEEYNKEDIDCNGVVDILDLTLVSSSYNAKNSDNNYNVKYDINKDKIIDIYDLVLVSKKILF